MSLFGNLQPSALHRVRASSDLMNEDPATWTGDWRKCPNGRYLTGDRQKTVATVLSVNDRMLVGMAIRNAANVANGTNGTNGTIGAVLGVSREAVAKRLRPLGLNAVRGRPAGKRLRTPFSLYPRVNKCASSEACPPRI